MGSEQKYIMASEKEEVEETIEYYNSYKKKLSSVYNTQLFLFTN